MASLPFRGLMVAAAATALFVAAPARADQLDKKLDAAMPDVVAKLRQKGYKNVGTLRFSVKQAGKKASYTAPLSGSLATRLENLLVMHGGPKESPLGVIQDASKTARTAKVGAWPESPAERKKLFTLDYPLAWGNKTVKPDAFLTGTVELSKDMRKATLKLQVIDRKTAAISELKTVQADPGLQLVRDLGYSVALGPKARSRMIARKATARDTDRLVMDVIDDPNTGDKNKPGGGVTDDGGDTIDKPDGNKGNDVKSTDVGGVTVDLLSGGTKIEFRKSSADGDAVAWQVASPAPGKSVTFKLKNNSDKKRAVVIRLNGVNMINQQKAEPENCGKFVLEPGKELTVPGYIMVEAPEGSDTGKVERKVVPIKVLTGDAAKTAREDLGDKAGMIEIDVFEEGAGVVNPDMQITLRGLPKSKELKARKDYTSLRQALVASAGKKIVRVTDRKTAVSRELLVPDTDAGKVDGKATVVTFNPQFVARIAVKVIPAEPTPD